PICRPQRRGCGAGPTVAWDSQLEVRRRAEGQGPQSHKGGLHRGGPASVRAAEAPAKRAHKPKRNELPGGVRALRLPHSYGGVGAHRDARAPGPKGQALRHVVDLVLWRSEEHTSELQSRENLVCRLLLGKKKK